MFKKVLIANRGEIAVRVIRACREMGITDGRRLLRRRPRRAARALRRRGLPHRPAARPRVLPRSASASSRSRNGRAPRRSIPATASCPSTASFADLCDAAGVTFIGPRGDVMRSMGDKVDRAPDHGARRRARSCPGTTERLTDEAIERWVRDVGPPVMIKAAAGGGGKGMRLVRERVGDSPARSRARGRRRRPPSATTRSTSRSSSRSRATSRSRSWPTPTATPSTSSSASARSSAATRR